MKFPPWAQLAVLGVVALAVSYVISAVVKRIQPPDDNDFLPPPGLL